MGVLVFGRGELADAATEWAEAGKNARRLRGVGGWQPTASGLLAHREESQAAWEGLLQDLYRRGLEGEKLLLIVRDGRSGWASAIETVKSQ